MSTGFPSGGARAARGLHQVTKSALYVREPLPTWSRGAVGLLGDACHPMVPFMAQGACMAIEDAVVLARALKGVDAAGVPAALADLRGGAQAADVARAGGSRGNEWLKEGGNADWVYGYDAGRAANGAAHDSGFPGRRSGRSRSLAC